MKITNWSLQEDQDVLQDFKSEVLQICIKNSEKISIGELGGMIGSDSSDRRPSAAIVFPPHLLIPFLHLWRVIHQS